MPVWTISRTLPAVIQVVSSLHFVCQCSPSSTNVGGVSGCRRSETARQKVGDWQVAAGPYLFRGEKTRPPDRC